MARNNRKSESNPFSRPMSSSSSVGTSSSVMTPKQDKPQTLIKEIGSKSNANLTYQQIADRAKKIWQQKGCPSGQDEKNWLEAEAQLKKELAVK